MILIKEGVELEKMGFKRTDYENDGSPVFVKQIYVSGYVDEYGLYAIVNGVGAKHPRELNFEADCGFDEKGNSVGMCISTDELYKIFKHAEEANV